MGFSFVPWLTRLRTVSASRMKGIRANTSDRRSCEVRPSPLATRPLAVLSHVPANKDCFMPARACHAHGTHPVSINSAKSPKGERRSSYISHLYIKLADRKVKYSRARPVIFRALTRARLSPAIPYKSLTIFAGPNTPLSQTTEYQRTC